MISPITSRSQAPDTAAAEYFPLQHPYPNGGVVVGNIALAQNPMTDSGTLSNLFFRLTTAPGAGASWTINLLKNGSASGLTVTISDANLEAIDTTHTISYVAGDLFTIETVPSVGTVPAASGLTFWAVDNDSSGQCVMSGTTTTSSNAADSFLSFQTGIRATASTSMQTIIPTDGVIDNLYLHVSGTLGAARTYTATLVKNGSDTALTATVTASELINSNTATDISVSAGDLLYWRITPSGTPTTRACHPSVRFTPTIDGESIQCYTSSANLGSATAKHYMSATAGGALVTNGTQNNRLNMFSTSYQVKKLHAAVDVAPGAGKSWAIAVYTASADTSVVTSISDANTTATPDTTHTDTIAATTRVGFAWLGTGTPTLSPSRGSFVTYRAPASSGAPQRMLMGIGT